MDARIYLISATYVSNNRYKELADTLVEASPCPALAVRLDTEGDGMWRALDEFTVRGARRIELRPIGLPFSQSLEKWLPGAAGSWLARQGAMAPELFLAKPAQADVRVIKSAARARVQLKQVKPQEDGEIGKGWDNPPDFKHHLLVCTGPRCHLKDAPDLAAALKKELGRQRLTSDCLVTTTGCLFPCNRGPVVVHYPLGNWYRLNDRSELRQFVSDALRDGNIPQNLLIHQTGVHHEFA